MSATIEQPVLIDLFSPDALAGLEYALEIATNPEYQNYYRGDGPKEEAKLQAAKEWLAYAKRRLGLPLDWVCSECGSKHDARFVTKCSKCGNGEYEE